MYRKTVFALKRLATILTVIAKLAREMDTFKMVSDIVYVRVLLATICAAVVSLSIPCNFLHVLVQHISIKS